MSQTRPPPSPGEGQTWHDDLWEAQLPGHYSGPVHQVWVVLADLNDVTHKHLHGHPETWKRMLAMKSQLQDVLGLTLPPLSLWALSGGDCWKQRETDTDAATQPRRRKEGRKWRGSGARHVWV